MEDFLAFREAGSLARQCAASRQDIFASLHAKDDLAGFFCLRGLDAGYSRPSFGVYVASRFARRGLARFALKEALRLCGERGIPRVMLKVAPGNSTARRLYEEAGFMPCGDCADTGHQMMEKVLGNG
jgi:RimJ/RimL family protein N-acetyltransferase